MSWIAFEIAINIFEGWMYCYFLRQKMSVKPTISRKVSFLCTLLTILLIAAYYSLYIWIDIKISDTVVWLIPFLYSLYLFSEKWVVKLGWNMCAAVLALCVVNTYSSLFMALTGKTWAEIMAPSFQRVVVVTHCNITMFALLYVIAKIKRRQSRLSIYTLGLFVILNAMYIIGLEMLFELSLISFVPDFPVVVAIICLLGASLGTLAMFELLSYNAEKQSRMEIEFEITRLAESHNNEVHSMYKELVEYRHNMKNHLAILEHMINSCAFSESKKYLSEMKRITAPIRFVTGCTAVDAILSAKAIQMQKLDIKFELISYPLHELPINTVDFCAMIGNLLDNAIEAIVRLPQGYQGSKIALKFARTRNMLYIVCKNRADPNQINIHGTDFISSKRNGKTGIGIPNIRRIVDNAEGYCSFQVVNHEMVVEISLPYIGGMDDDQ